MTYSKTTWVDEVLAGAERFDIKDNAGNPINSNVQIVLATGVTVPGTPLNAANLNHMEDGIAGLDTQLNTLDVDRKLSIGYALQDGVVCGVGNDLFCFGDASGMQVKVRSGAAHIKGYFFSQDVETVLAIGAAPGTAGQARYDLVVLELDWVEKAISLKVIAGTPAVSGSQALPALTKSGSTVWQIPLARVTVAYGNTSIAAASVTMMRRWALGTFDAPIIIGNGQSVIPTGPVPVGLVIPERSRILSVHLTADVSGSIQLDFWKDTWGNYPPTVADTIVAASNKISLTSSQKAAKFVWNEATNPNYNMLNWPGSVFDLPTGDVDLDRMVLLTNVDSVATIKQLNCTLRFARMISYQS